MATTRTARRTRLTFWGGVSATATGLVLLVALMFPATANATVSSIALHNNTADTSTDCPAGGAAYWHFVFAPNDGSSSFVTITLNLTSETVTFSGADIIPNGAQTDNVFVAVPAGHTLTDLVTAGSSATYTGDTPKLFNLSHVCDGTVPPTTTTTAAPTTTTTAAPTTTTTPPTTTTTAAPTTTTTEAPTTTTTTAAPTTTTTEAPTTTTTAAPTTTTTEAPTTTTTANVAPTSVVPSTEVPTTEAPTTEAPTTQSTQTNDTAQVLGITQTPNSTSALPVTGGQVTSLLIAAGVLVAGGLVLVLVARRRQAAALHD